MSVRPHPTKGPGWWIIDFYPQGRKGKRERMPFSGTEAQALGMETDLRMATKQVKTRLFPRIAEVVPDFMTHYKTGDRLPAGIERTQRSLKILLPFFGRYQFSQITPSLVENYKTMRLAQVKPSTINKELSALSSLCKWAAESERGYCHQIQIKRFGKKLTKAPLPKILTKEQVHALIAQAAPDKQGLFAVMYYAGLRSSEARFLHRKDISNDNKTMIVRGKGDKERTVPILQELEPYLLAANKTGYLWTNPTTREPWKDIRGALAGAAKRAGIEQRVTPHLLRHCFGTHSTISGVGLITLQMVMGHSTSKVTEEYVTLAAKQLISDMQKFSDYSSQ